MDEIVRASLVLLLLVILVIVPNIKHVSHNQAIVVERLGSFHRILTKPGFYILIPLFERAIQSVSLDRITGHIKLDDQTKLDYVYKIVDVKTFVYQALDSIHAFHEDLRVQFVQDSSDDFLESMTEIAVEYGMNILECKINNN